MAFLSVSTVMSQMSLAYRCAGEFVGKHWADVKDWAGVYASLVVLKLIMWASISFWNANKRLKTKGGVTGDLVKEADMDWRDRNWTKVYTTFFHMFSVPTVVTDTSVHLHVRKPVQPYVTFKNKGHRAWILGWPSQEQFKVETQDRALPNLVMGIIFDLLLTVMQFMLNLADDWGYWIEMLMAFSVSFICFVYRFYKLVILVRYKIRLYYRLKDLTAMGVAAAEQEGEQALKQFIVNSRLLQDHCFTKMPSAVCEKASEIGWGA